MIGPWRNRKAVLLIVLVLVCTVAAFSFGMAYPTEVANPALGAGWQCLRTAGIVTTCHRVVHAEPMSHRSQTQAADTRRV
jgi:hypothetical protein